MRFCIITQLYGKYRVLIPSSLISHCYVHHKFKFINKSLYTKNDYGVTSILIWFKFEIQIFIKIKLYPSTFNSFK